MRKLVASAALAIAVSASVASAADDYKIKLTRPFKVGDAMEVVTSVEVKAVQKVDLAGQVKENKTEFKAVLEGVQTVDAVNDKGSPTKLTVKVDKCTKDGDELIPKGATLTAENVDGKTQFKIDGNDPTDDVKAALEEMVDTSKPDAPGEDELSGTDKLVKVGDTWSLHTDAIAKEISEPPIMLTGDQIKGESKLTDISTVGGKPSETIAVTLSADVPAKDPNNGANVHDLKLDVNATLTCPIDDSSHVATSKFNRKMSFMMDTPGPVVTVKYDVTREDKMSEVKK